MPALMSKQGLKLALESDGFTNLNEQEAFHELWNSLGGQPIDVNSFHAVLRLLKLHLLCGTVPSMDMQPDIPEEDGFIGVMDWNPRSIDEHYFRQPRHKLMVFLTHRDPQMKMRWVHGFRVAKPTVLRLAVKYQLHPLTVEDTIQLEQQSVPLVRHYGCNFFIIIPLLRLSNESKDQLERYKAAMRQQDKSHRPKMASEVTEPVSPQLPPADSTAHTEPCRVQVEQGRLAMFVSGPPNYDTVISVQTKWIVRNPEEGSYRGRMPHSRSNLHSNSRQDLAGMADRVRRASLRVGMALRRRASRHLSSLARTNSSLDSVNEDNFLASAAITRGELDLIEAEVEGEMKEDGDDMQEDDNAGTEVFDGVAREIQREFSVLRAGNAAWLLWRLIDVCVDELTPILAAYRARLQWFAAHIAHQRAKASSDVEKQLLRCKVELDWLQRKVRPMIRVVRHLIHDRTIDPEVTRYIEDVEDHLDTFLEEISRSVGVCDSLRDQVRSHRERQQQRVLYVLALVTTMFLPMQVLTGMYGMNFQDADGNPAVPGLGQLTEDRGAYLFWGLGVIMMSLIFLTYRLVLRWI